LAAGADLGDGDSRARLGSVSQSGSASLGASRGMTVSASWLSGSPTSSVSSRAEIGAKDASVCMRPPWFVVPSPFAPARQPLLYKEGENRANQADVRFVVRSITSAMTLHRGHAIETAVAVARVRPPPPGRRRHGRRET